ncbi:sigma factor-like helix-turn-helix DNA-binding protein [Streptomyces sp. NPDC058372]|uniref:sigma factor-like helix-turn-helix DNA-binding protein n=1 Tax=Streptomyces sp. NPDC058372 TaxID=3346464 RepID=UPI00364B3E81
MSPRHEIPRTARARAFASFAAGAGGRLLHLATLLTAEPPGDAPYARRLLTAALARTYADWDTLRGGDPYDRTRQDLVARYARAAWHRRLVPAGRAPAPGPLGALTPPERVAVVLRLYEGVPEEQAAALLGLHVERVRALTARATVRLTRPPGAAPETPERAR